VEIDTVINSDKAGRRHRSTYTGAASRSLRSQSCRSLRGVGHRSSVAIYLPLMRG